MSEIMWIMGVNCTPSRVENVVWELMGVFDDRQKAIEACTLPNHFIGSITLNERLSDQSETWPDAFYPIIGAE